MHPALPLDYALQSASAQHRVHTLVEFLGDRRWDSGSLGPSAEVPIAKRNSEGIARCSVPSNPRSLLVCCFNCSQWLARMSKRDGGSKACPWLKAAVWWLKCQSLNERKIGVLKCFDKRSYWREVHLKKYSDYCYSWSEGTKVAFLSWSVVYDLKLTGLPGFTMVACWTKMRV